MSLFTSSHFASACANGTDWRDTSKNILEKLDGIRTEDDQFNFGILYVSDHLVDDMNSILNLFKSVLKIDHWIGSVAMGVIGCRDSYLDQPAISAMLCRFPEDSFCIFPDINDQDEMLKSQDRILEWLSRQDFVTALVHGDPMAEEDPREVLKDMEQSTNAFVLGGMSSSRSHHYQIANTVLDNSICGAFLSSDVSIATTLSQGCTAVSPFHIVTKADENTILELDDKPALKVFEQNLRELSAKKLGKSPEEFQSDIDMIENSDHIPQEFKGLFKGDIHIGVPNTKSDMNNYMIHNITDIDTDEYSISLSEVVQPGSTIFLAERNQHNLEKDLSRSLVALQKRILRERGSFDPRAALYISCLARGFVEPEEENREIQIIHDVIGNVPMTGFYAGGEISNAQIYGYTGILTLFF